MKQQAKDIQKIFEFVVKHKDGMIDWPNAMIRKFIRWAVYYRKLFIVWADAPKGSKRIVAVGVAWQVETPGLKQILGGELTVENTEYGDILFVYQVVVHPEFRATGVLFQLLSLALWRFPMTKSVLWYSARRHDKKARRMPVATLVNRLASQAKLSKLKKYIKEKDPKWEKAADQTSLMFKFLQ